MSEHRWAKSGIFNGVWFAAPAKAALRVTFLESGQWGWWCMRLGTNPPAVREGQADTRKDAMRAAEQALDEIEGAS